jgi:hypothetical protein
MQDIVSVGGRWVYVPVEFLGIEWGVVEVSNGKGEGVGRGRHEAVASSHKVLGEGHMSVEAEVEAHAPGSAMRDAASSPASVSSGVVIGGAVVVV